MAAYDVALHGLAKKFEEGKAGIRSFLVLQKILRRGELDEEALAQCNKYPELSTADLGVQLLWLHMKYGATTVEEATDCLRCAHPEVCHVFTDVEQLIRLLVRPATSCEAELTFSSLRQLKTWLIRSTMTQKRLSARALFVPQP